MKAPASLQDQISAQRCAALSAQRVSVVEGKRGSGFGCPRYRRSTAGDRAAFSHTRARRQPAAPSIPQRREHQSDTPRPPALSCPRCSFLPTRPTCATGAQRSCLQGSVPAAEAAPIWQRHHCRAHHNSAPGHQLPSPAWTPGSVLDAACFPWLTTPPLHLASKGDQWR
eukprot:1556335-Rhodomonas_salina.1